ncbi:MULTISPECIES: sensor histidine kinase [unclassified Streptomyces]|uniref:sensor histidine kinase n=1 Tax=unclassified Streptomyces TaxID=2593676 RepID=UPI00081B1657|nr:nitrate- and nitrite sensing domain-containing protein [Streptomyces sp. DvalAA-43]MYQ87303.1 HAMP domain-containing protein [Streptomyces sp. SID4936]SCE44787.1 HAMP domain-containing protein [Streptomyces sp. DvalAA-43]
MQKKRPRSKGGKQHGSGVTSPAPAESEGTRRTVRVRSRLVAGVAVVGITVIAAGTPAILAASSELNESQRLVTLAELNQQATALAHALADERDEVTARIAAGRDTKTGATDGKDGSGSRSARVDRQVDEIRATAPASLRRDLSTIPSLRRDALSGKGTALEAHEAYSEVIAKLHDLADELAEKTPPRAAEATRAPLALGQATEQASATRGLLIAALSVPRKETVPQTDPLTGLPLQTQDSGSDKDDRTRDELSAAAQQARVRELASLADFDQAAGSTARDKLSSTVTGPEVNSAEKYLNTLTARPELSDSDQTTSSKKAEAALSARIDRMRSVESALGTEQIQRLERLRDDDVTALELRIALLGGCLLVAVGVSTAVARTLTQPLAVLRIGAARLAAEPDTAEPVRYTGRNDEFAQVVRSLNSLHGRLHGLLHEFNGRFESLQTERGELIAGREALTVQRAELQVQAADLAAQLERLKNTVHHTFVNLSLRTLGLVERQLGVIEGLEEREHDPERLATLFKLDHMATVMRRHSENMLVLAGAEHGHGHPGAIPLVDVLRAAVSEIERYERVTIQSLPPHAQIAGFAADDLSHLVAELLENATAFSPPDSHVQLSGWLLESGEVMLSVQDEGIGMSAVRMGELNTRLADPALFEAGEQSADGAGLGLQVTSLLAARHGVRVQLRDHKGSGVTAVVVLPQALLPKAPPAATPPPVKVPGDAPALNLPGSVAEANSNALPARTLALPEDPLIAAAEQTIREAAADQAPAPAAAPATEPAPTPRPEAPTGATPPAEVDSEVTMQVRLPVVPKSADTPGTATQDSYTGTDAPDPYTPGTATPDPYTPETGAGTGAGIGTGTPTPDPYAIGPDRHERVGDDTPEPRTAAPASMPLPGTRQPEQQPQPRPEQVEQAERITDKGLPKRTPRIVKPTEAPTTERKGSLDKEALRRRLGGFHQGAKDGRRDVEAEIAEIAATQSLPGATGPGGHPARTDQTDETGDTVEEARS